MRTFKFKQASLYGKDWDVTIKNVPDSAVFYKIDVLSEIQEEWYIMVPKEDFDKTYDEDNIDVRYYNFIDYVIIHLENIKPYDEWPDVGEDKFNELFEDYFKSCYLSERTRPKVEITSWEPFEYEEVEDGRLCSVIRFINLTTNGEIECTRVVTYDPLRKRETYCILNTTMRLCDTQNGIYDPLKLDKVLSHDYTTYATTFKKVTCELY